MYHTILLRLRKASAFTVVLSVATFLSQAPHLWAQQAEAPKSVPGTLGFVLRKAPPLPIDLVVRDRAVDAALTVAATTVLPSLYLSGADNYPIKVTFINTSGRRVTAFKFATDVTYSTGRRERIEGGLDCVENLASAKAAGKSYARLFEVGEEQTHTHIVTARRAGETVVHVEVIPALVVFEDRTALGAAEMRMALGQRRRAHVKALDTVIGEVRAAIETGRPAEALAEQRRQLAGKDANSLMGAEAELARRLKSLDASDADSLRRSLASIEVERSVLMEHSVLEGTAVQNSKNL